MYVFRKIPRLIFFWKYKRFLKKDTARPNKSVVHGRGIIVRIDLYDVLDNGDVHKLIRKIVKLSKNEFRTKLYYKKRRFRHQNYIRPQFDHTSTALFADIDLLNDNCIRSVNLSWTQINNDEAIMQYSFTLKRPIRTINDCRKFMLEHWDWLRAAETLPYYKSIDVLSSSSNEGSQYIYNLFLSCFQGFVNKNLHTNLGHKYQLPVNVLRLAKRKTAIDKVVNEAFLYSLFKKRDRDVYIGYGVVEKWQTDTIIIGDSYSNDGLLGYFSDYSMDYYYLIFGDIEVNELSRRLAGFLNKGKTKISLKDRKWLLKKFRRVSELKLCPKVTLPSGVIGLTKDVSGEDYIRFGIADKFKDVYEDNLKYVGSVFGLTDVHIMVWIAWGISFLGLVVSSLSLANNLFRHH